MTGTKAVPTIRGTSPPSIGAYGKSRIAGTASAVKPATRGSSGASCLASTNIPTIFLDREFRVKRFTPAMLKLRTDRGQKLLVIVGSIGRLRLCLGG